MPKPVPLWTGGTLLDALEFGIQSNHAALECEADRARIHHLQESAR